MEGEGPPAGGDPAAPPANLPGGAPEPGVTASGPDSHPPCRFFLAGSCSFGAHCRNPHPGAPPAAPRPAPRPRSPSKKPPMKTAGDVVSRILWDPQLPPEAFAVGYLDRFLGVLEEPFAAFSWEDLASAGPGVLAVPQHRIQYVKYRGRLVWDKASRLDHVFGSTGGGRTILQVMEEEGEPPPGAAGTGEGGSAGGRPPAPPGADGGEGPEEAAAPESREEAGDEDDEAAPGPQSCPPAPPRRPRPTHFVAARVTSPSLRGSVARLQEALAQAQPALAEFCVPLPTLHLTLCLLRLEGPGAVQGALAALRELQAERRRLLPPAPLLRFRRPAAFRGRVLYTAPEPSPELEGLAGALARGFARKGLTVLQPPGRDCLHLTLAKIPAGREPGLSLPPELPGAPCAEELGTQAVESLCLCQVGRGRRTDGFYSTVLELDLY